MPRTTEAAGRADYTRAFKPRRAHLSAALAVCVLRAFEKNRWREIGHLYEPSGM